MGESNRNSFSSTSDDFVKIRVIVAIDRDKGSQHAVRWAIENIKMKDNSIALVHVNIRDKDDEVFLEQEGLTRSQIEADIEKLFVLYRGYCCRKGVMAKEVVLHDPDIPKSIGDFLHAHNVTKAVFGDSSRSSLTRAFKSTVANMVGKHAPDNCTVYVVSKGGKAKQIKTSNEPEEPETPDSARSTKSKEYSFSSNDSSIRSASEFSSFSSDPLRRNNGWSIGSMNNNREHLRGLFSNSGSSSPSNSVTTNKFSIASKYPSPLESTNSSSESLNNFSRHSGSKMSTIMKPVKNKRVLTKDLTSFSMSGSSNQSDGQSFSSGSTQIFDQSSISYSSRSSMSSQTSDLEDELKKLKLELVQLSEKYNAAEAAISREKPFHPQDEGKLGEGIITLAIVEKEREKTKAAVEMANKAQRIAELESEKRKLAEKKFKLEAAEKQKAINALTQNAIKYRKYAIEEIERVTNHFSNDEKIGEGGYGPVYKAILDHTPVAIKVLRADIAEGHTQFHREIEVLSRMRHPNMVILLGACPENGCLIYEYMENGSLEDRLYCKDGTKPLSWPTRFKIAAEIATALNFLHQTKPEPLVHRDLKPANILLDQNYVSKISDVGLSRLVPPSVADNVTQYHMTAAAGTFCYIDPEYQQTGMLGTKSDIYSLGVLLLQIITAKPAMGLTFCVENAIEIGQFEEVLDPMVLDWPVEEALSFAKLALQCCELRKRDRPNLDTVILPKLQRLRDIGTECMAQERSEYVSPRGLSFQGSV